MGRGGCPWWWLWRREAAKCREAQRRRGGGAVRGCSYYRGAWEVFDVVEGGIMVQGGNDNVLRRHGTMVVEVAW